MGYWENRQAQQMYEAMEDAEQVAKELSDLYAKASRHINFELDKIYERFRDKYHLSDAEALRLLNSLKDPTSLEELKRKLSLDPKNKDLLAELESAAYRARIERLENLQNEIDLMMRNVFEQEKKITTAHYVDLAQNAYYRQIFDIQRQVGFQFSFSAADPRAIALVLSSKWSGENYSTRIWNNTQGLAKDVKEQLLLGLLTGKREEDMAKEIANKFATGSFEARRLVRTESSFVNGQMQLDAYEECDADEYEFIATLDLKTSKICRELDGKVFKVKDAMPGVNMNPMHPFCRSTTGIHLSDEITAGLKRRARDPVTGEPKLVPAGTNYEKWYQQNVANNPKAQAVEKMFKNRSSDMKQWERYKEVVGSKRAGRSLAAFQDMKYNDPERWAYNQGLYRYLNKYPESSDRFYRIKNKADELGMHIGVPLPPKPKAAIIAPDIGSSDPNHIYSRMAERTLTEKELEGYIKKAKIMCVQRGGNGNLFIAEEGATVILRRDDGSWIYKTGWPKENHDPKILALLEEYKNYGK